MEFRLKTLSLQGGDPRAGGGGVVKKSTCWSLALCQMCPLFSCSVLLTATSEDEVNMWIKGLTWLMEDTLQAATPLQIER